MAGAWTPAPWSRWKAPWARTLKLAQGAFITPQLRLVRPCAGADAETVWVADHLALEIQVAVTFARVNSGSENVAAGSAAVDLAAVEAARFTRQAQCSARIGDPHVVQIFEHGVAKGGVPFIVTELLEGKGLRQRLTYGGPLSLAEAQAIVTQAAGALAKAHALQLTHGSISPDNLFLIEAGGQPFVKIRNFCSVNPAELQANPNLAYHSPEQLLSSAGCSAQSDLWALAVTVYELLTTILPFEAPTTAGVTVAICNAQFSPPSHYRADLLADIDLWFARALSKEPLDRFHDARELARAFSRAASAEALLAPADPAAAAQVAPELEDEEEEEEKTVKWDLPADWAPGSSRSALTQVIQRPILSEPPPLPNRAPSSRPPAPVGLSRPGMFPQLGSVSAALAARVVAGASPRVWPRVPNRLSERASIGWVAGALLAAGALILWSYQSSSDREKLATEMLEAPPTSTRALVAAKVKSAPEPSEAKSGAHARRPLAGPPRDRQVHAAQLHAERGAEPQELPDIIRTDELPTAPEVDDIEVTDDEATAEGASGEGEADEARPDTAPAPHSPPAPAPIASTIPAANKPAPSITTSNSVAVYRKPPAPRAAPKPAASSVPNRKAASAKAAPNCNPPFYYDNNNIRRLKLECL